jgi:hypothetical protein
MQEKKLRLLIQVATKMRTGMWLTQTQAEQNRFSRVKILVRSLRPSLNLRQHLLQLQALSQHLLLNPPQHRSRPPLLSLPRLYQSLRITTLPSISCKLQSLSPTPARRLSYPTQPKLTSITLRLMAGWTSSGSSSCTLRCHSLHRRLIACKSTWVSTQKTLPSLLSSWIRAAPLRALKRSRSTGRQWRDLRQHARSYQVCNLNALTWLAVRAPSATKWI